MLNNYIDFLNKGSKIHIKESHKGKFTDYCGGKVTDACIAKGKKSPSAKIRKQATFAKNARSWKHQSGGRVFFNVIKDNRDSSEIQDPRRKTEVDIPESQSEGQEQTTSSENWWDNIINEMSSQQQTSQESTSDDQTNNPEVENQDESTQSEYEAQSESGKRVINYLMNHHGLSKAAATGVAKVFKIESGLTPGIRNQDELERYGDDKAGIGIAQWSNDRRRLYGQYMQSHGYTTPTIENELDFFIEEAKTRPAFWNALTSAKDYKQAVDAMYYGYENGSAGAMATRDQIVSAYTRAHRSLYGKQFNIDESLNNRYNAEV